MLVIVYLSCKGYTILKRRYRTHIGEIDIIAKRGNQVSFIEVKSRFNQQNLIEVLTMAQIKRIKQTAIFFLSKNLKFSSFDVSFDLIKVYGFWINSHDKNYF